MGMGMNKKTTLRPVRASTLQDSVYQELFQAIVSGRIEPGERIVLETLANQLGVSIMPVREAIRKLEAGNLVTIQNRRIVVNKLSPKNIKDILKVRLMLEGYAASEAARIRKEEIIPLLEELLVEMSRTEDIEEYLKANRRFHNTIYNECDNPALVEVIDSLWERYSPYLHILLDNLIDWRQPEFTRNHNEMLKAVRHGDPAGAKKWVEQDLLDAAESVLNMMALKDDREEGEEGEPDEGV